MSKRKRGKPVYLGDLFHPLIQCPRCGAMHQGTGPDKGVRSAVCTPCRNRAKARLEKPS